MASKLSSAGRADSVDVHHHHHVMPDAASLLFYLTLVYQTLDRKRVIAVTGKGLDRSRRVPAKLMLQGLESLGGT